MSAINIPQLRMARNYRLDWRQTPYRLRTAPQELQDTLRVFHEFALCMMVAIVLQLPQTTVNCCFSRSHAHNQMLWV